MPEVQCGKKKFLTLSNKKNLTSLENDVIQLWETFASKAFYTKKQLYETRTGRYQGRSEAISSSFSFSRSNRDVTSFPRKQFLQNFIVGTNQPTNGPTDGPTDQRTNIA
jgi:hypothetical protein